jgi:hypothetical protein
MRVNLLPSRIKPRALPFPAWYCPTMTPALLIQPRAVLRAPGTRTVVNLKLNVGAFAAVAAIMNASTKPGTSSSALQVFMVFPLGRRFELNSIR